MDSNPKERIKRTAPKGDNLINREIAGYLIKKFLGRGGMGTVYKARQLSLDRNVALKILATSFGENKDFVQQFIQEARSCAQLNHRNIIQVYDAGEYEGIYYLSMEYAMEGCVQKLIDKGKKLEPLEAIGYIIDAAYGLEYAEKRQIVHRDIKPGNLMLSEDKVVKIGDLGLAIRPDEVQAETPSRIIGTPHYISPEQAQGLPLDHRADIYSLGVSFYRILSGALPFSGKNSREIVDQHIYGQPVPLQTLVPSLPPSITRTINKMMRKKPEERYAGNTLLIKDLEHCRKVLLGDIEEIVVLPSPPVFKNFLFYIIPLIFILLSSFIYLLFCIPAKAPIAPPKTPLIKKQDPVELAYRQACKKYQQQKSIQELQQVAQKYPHSSWGKKAAALIEQDQKKAINLKQQKAHKLFKKAKLYEQKHPQAYAKIIEQYNAIISEYAEFPITLEARKEIARLKPAHQKWLHTRRQEQQLVQLHHLIQKKKLSQAQKKLAQLTNQNQGFPDIQKKIKDCRIKLQEAVDQWSQNLAQQIQKLIQKKEYQKAQTKIGLLKNSGFDLCLSKATELEAQLQEAMRPKNSRRFRAIPKILSPAGSTDPGLSLPRGPVRMSFIDPKNRIGI